MNVQLIGTFNSGTNLVANIIKQFFDCKIHTEGHTLFWKHSLLTNEFMADVIKNMEQSQSSTFFIIVIKRLDWWLDSISKHKYTIEFQDSNVIINPPFRRPQDKFIVPNNHIVFNSLEEYYNTFYESAFKSIPSKRILVLRYQDVLLHSINVIKQIANKIPLKKIYKLNPNILTKELTEILEKPAKKTGNSRYGNKAKQYYTELIHKKSNTSFVETYQCLFPRIKKIYSNH